MPNLPTHMGLALDVASRLAHPTIDTHLGSFLLGSTSPDIRIMTKWERARTHFAPVTIECIGAGVEGLLEANPDLASSDNLNDATRVFLSGYFSHLVADETWILDIYRPYFDGHRLFADQVRANIWDRALQLDMDKSTRAELGSFEEVRVLLEGSESGVAVGFISPETLGQWREWVVAFTTWEFTWERLRFATHRMYGDNTGAMEMVEEFLRCVPGSLEDVYNNIHRNQIAGYRETAIEGSVRTIREYMGEPDGDQRPG